MKNVIAASCACLLRGRNHRRHLGTRLAVARMAGSWKLRLDSLCNLFLCQAAHYANTLFTVGVTVSRHESRWGLRAAAQYQERRRRWKRTRWQKERSTELPAFVLRSLYL